MKTRAIIAVFFAFAVVGGFAAESYERYQPIVDRMPFGVPPDGFDPTASAQSSAEAKAAAEEEAQIAAEQAKLMSKVRICALNVNPGGIAYVGFVDSSDKTPYNYYLCEGESKDGWSVTCIDPNASSVTLEKDGISITLPLGGASGEKDSKNKNGNTRGRPSRPVAAPTASPIGRLQQRQADKLAEEARKKAELQKREEERKRKAEEDEARRQEEAEQAKAEKEEQASQLAKQREEMDNLKASLEKLRQESKEKKAEEEEVSSETAE